MLMMLSFGHAFCPKYDDDGADDDRLLAASNLQPLGDINGAGLWQLPSRVKPLGDINGAGLRPLPFQVHYCAKLAAWDFRRHAVQKSSIASTFEECSSIGSGQTDEGFAKVVASCFRMEGGAESENR